MNIIVIISVLFSISVLFTKEKEIESNWWTDKELDEICEIVESAECAMKVFNDKLTSIESRLLIHNLQWSFVQNKWKCGKAVSNNDY